MFKCDMCGLCCQNLDTNTQYDDLNDGTGVCIYFDADTNRCKIYNRRPDKCNVDKSYMTFFKDVMPLEEYYKLNYEACEALKKKRATLSGPKTLLGTKPVPYL